MSLYGSPGYLDMPSARFQSDGTLSVTVETKQPDDRITIAFQATPWLEGTARYSVVNNFFGTDTTAAESGALYDRSLGLRVRLWPEGRYVPQIAAGLLDIGGTAIFGAEYLVATKKFGPVDASLGVGWGRFGTTGMLENPLVHLSDRFRTRSGIGNIKKTGQFDFGDFFSGEDASLFGGVQVSTPIRGLNLIAEYSGDEYRTEEQAGLYGVESQVNFGVGYAPNNNVELGAGWLGGRELSLRLTLRLNLDDPVEPFKLDPPPKPVAIRDELELRESIAVGLNAEAKGSAPGQQPQIGQILGPGSTLGETASAPVSGALDTAYRTATLERFAAGISEQLAPISYRLDRFALEGSEAVFEVSAMTVRPPLECSEIWNHLRAERLPGIERLTFVDSGTEIAPLRCTRIIAGGNGRTAKTDFAARPSSAPTAPATPPASAAPDPAPEPDRWWEDPSEVARVQRGIIDELKGQRLRAESIIVRRDEVEIWLLNPTYISTGKAVGRAARAITHVLPNSVERMAFVLSTGNVNGTRIEISRRTLERVSKTIGSPEEIFVQSQFSQAEPGLPSGGYEPGRNYPYFDPIFGPGFKQSLFDPDDPLRFQVFWKLGGTIHLARGLYAQGVYSLDIWNNFDTITRESDSVLPRVRSEAARYLKEGDNGVERLQFTYVRQIRPEWYGRISAGLLEDMFGGVSAEVLYRPFGKRWALGGELSQVWQRDFDRGFGFQDYDVLTGHVSAYYDSPFYDLDFAVHSGRYLAGDDGLTFEVNRRFANGALVGAYATFTDVGFERFGEGSFDKGIVIRIPFDLISLFSTRRTTGITFSPLTRDGGARLNAGPRLYDMTYNVSFGAVQETWDDLLARR